MKESLKTTLFLILALALCGGAYFSRPKFEGKKQWVKIGTEFYADFKDPLQVAVLEITSFNEVTGSYEVFKVEKRGERWYLPSHENYPADAAGKMAEIATSFIGLKRQELRSSELIDHQSLQLIDPTDSKAGTVEGRGIKLVLRDKDQQILCQYIIGRKDERKAFHLIRLPHESQSYAVPINVELDKKFTSWVNPALWVFSAHEISDVFINDYSVVQKEIKQGTPYGISQDDQGIWRPIDEKWTVKQDEAKKYSIYTRQFWFSGVSRKHPRFVEYLAKGKEFLQDREVVEDLAKKGFYIGPQGIISDEGELIIKRKNGIYYTIRFGTLKASLGKGGEKNQRYCMIFAGLDREGDPEPKVDEKPIKPLPIALKETWDKYNDDLEKIKAQKRIWDIWHQQRTKAEAELADLNERLADWYFLIDQDIYEKMKPSKKSLTQ